MNVEQIMAYIKADEKKRKRMRRLLDYYLGEHDILRRARDKDKPNNRLVHGFPRYIANAYTGYVFGEPVAYNSADEDLKVLVDDAFRYNDEQSENGRLGLDCAIYGEAWEVMYMDADSVPRFARVEPMGCIGVTDQTIEDNLTALIRCYDTTDLVTNTITGHVEVYDSEVVQYYEVSGGYAAGIPKLVKEECHAWGDVPAVRYLNNTVGQGDYEGVLTLIDAYNAAQSDALNDQDYFSDAYLALYGIQGMEPEDAAKMKEDRLLQMPIDSKAEWLVKQQNDAVSENLKERLNHDIHRFSACPDMSDENFAGNASGVALRYKLLQFENTAAMKEREFKRGLQRRLELLCNIWGVLAQGGHDWRDVQISFKRALPQNLLELSQVVSNLSDVLSDETKRSILPLDIDEETEKQRLEAENEGSIFDLHERRTTEVKADGVQV